MRNTLVYPITRDEIADCLTKLASEISAKNAEDLHCGDMRPLLLKKAAELISAMDSSIVEVKSIKN